MSSRHKDETLGVSGRCEVFPSLETCPLCAQYGATASIEDAIGFLRQLERLRVEGAEGLIKQVRELHRTAERLTWSHLVKKEGA